jgi:hypothetical protein
MTILPVDHYGDHKVGPIIFILGESVAKYKDMPYVRRLTEIGSSKWPPRGFYGQSLYETHIKVKSGSLSFQRAVSNQLCML